MLLQEEQYVVQWLSQYGALAKTQVIRLLWDKPQKTAEKIIHNLRRQMHIAGIAGGHYLGLDSMIKPDQRTILAVWVLLKYIDQIEPLAHYPASYPAQIFFLKDGIGYEILVLFEGEQHLVRLLQPQEDLKYIIVVPNTSMIRELRLPNAPCLFSTVDFKGQDEPAILFYSGVSDNGKDANKL